MAWLHNNAPISHGLRRGHLSPNVGPETFLAKYFSQSKATIKLIYIVGCGELFVGYGEKFAHSSFCTVDNKESVEL